MNRWKRCGFAVDRKYEIVDDGKGIKFTPCGVVSYHPEDVKHRFCAYCDRFVGNSEQRADK